MILQGKIAFITGSSRGIGWETAREFARQGATVVVNSRAADPSVDERCTALAAEHATTVLNLPADVRDTAAVKGCYKEIFRRFRRLDVLVNNAGVMNGGLIGMISEDLVRDTLAVNLAGAIAHLQEAGRLMVRNKSGAIINLSSIIGRMGTEGQTVYAASKAGIIGMTLAAAKELGPSGVRVNAVAPGFIDTAMTQALSAEKRTQTIAGIRMGRAGQAEEVARVIAFLASDMASYVTGQVLGVDGGMVV